MADTKDWLQTMEVKRIQALAVPRSPSRTVRRARSSGERPVLSPPGVAETPVPAIPVAIPIPARRRSRRRLSPGRGRVLDVADVSVAFGAVKALDGVTLDRAGRFLRRAHRPQRRRQDDVLQRRQRVRCADTQGGFGSAGSCIDTWSPASRARAGLARTFQNIGLDKQATVADNLKVARQGGAIGDELRVTLGLRRGEAAEFRAEALIERLELQDVLG